MRLDFDWDEVNTLIHILQAKGLSYLIGTTAPVSEKLETIDDVQLIQRLAACGYPLVEDASISLFILHPELASSIVPAMQTSDPEIAENIAVLTLATLYMQQWWLFRLAFALGRLPSFPEELFTALWEERHLPPPSSDYGQDGLLALQEYQQQRLGLPLNFLHDWQNQINHLLAQEQQPHRTLSDDLKQELKKLSNEDAAYYSKKERTASLSRKRNERAEKILRISNCCFVRDLLTLLSWI